MGRLFSSWTGRAVLAVAVTVAASALVIGLVAVGAGAPGPLGALVVSMIFAGTALLARRRWTA